MEVDLVRFPKVERSLLQRDPRPIVPVSLGKLRPAPADHNAQISNKANADEQSGVVCVPVSYAVRSLPQ